jgi:hypothetical protein
MNAYTEAAKQDEFLFGDYDYETEWLEKKGNNILGGS